MYTFNLSRAQRQANAKGKTLKKDGSAAGVPAGEDAIDIMPIDMQAKNERKSAAPADTQQQQLLQPSSASGANPEEEKDRSQERTIS